MQAGSIVRERWEGGIGKKEGERAKEGEGQSGIERGNAKSLMS